MWRTVSSLRNGRGARSGAVLVLYSLGRATGRPLGLSIQHAGMRLALVRYSEGGVMIVGFDMYRNLSAGRRLEAQQKLQVQPHCGQRPVAMHAASSGCAGPRRVPGVGAAALTGVPAARRSWAGCGGRGRGAHTAQLEVEHHACAAGTSQRSLAQRTLMLCVVHAHAGRQELCTLRVLTFAKLNHARCSASALNGASRSRALRCKTT